MLETGVANFDRVLGGGIPSGDVLLVVGPAGSGKTTLGLQMAFRAAAAGHSALFASTLSETPSRLVKHTKGFSFYDEDLLGRHLFLLSIYPLAKEDLKDVADALISEVKEHRARLLVVDGLTTLRDLHPAADELSTFLYDLGATLATLECTTVLTSAMDKGFTRSDLPEFAIADGIVELDCKNIGVRTFRTIRATKMRGVAPLPGEHSLTIDGAGVTVFPRIESLYAPSDETPSNERVPLGIAVIDEMMGGGFPIGSATVLAGAIGTGKTLTGLQYVMAGAERGERGMIVGFRETPSQLMDKARNFGLDLESVVAGGDVATFHRPAVEIDLDRVTYELWMQVKRFAPKRLVVDSIVELEYAVLDDRRRRGYVTALANLLRSEKVTSLFTVETPRIVGPELDFGHTATAVLSENLLMLRKVEFRGELVGLVSILKMRDSAYDSSIRQYHVTPHGGVVIKAREEMSTGVLAALARLSGETRMRPASMSEGGW